MFEFDCVYIRFESLLCGGINDIYVEINII